MTWTSPDTGVADRPDEARLVQRGLQLNCTVSLCPATSPARTRAGPNAAYHIAYAISNARSSYVSRVIALVPGQPSVQRIVAGQRHAYGIVTAARICFKCVTNWLHLSGISGARERPPTLLPGQVTERNLYATVQCCRGASLCRDPAPDWPSFTDTNVIFRGRAGAAGARPVRQPSHRRSSPDVARADEIPGRQPAGQRGTPEPGRAGAGTAGETAGRRGESATRSAPRAWRPGTAQAQPLAGAAGPQPGPSGRPALPHQTHQHTAFTPNGDKCVQPGLILHFPSKEHY